MRLIKFSANFIYLSIQLVSMENKKKELENILERIKSGVDKLLVSILIVSLILLSFLSSRMK